MSEQIETGEALDALPAGSVVTNLRGDAWQRTGRNWYCAGVAGGQRAVPYPPFTVLFRPDAPTPTPPVVTTDVIRDAVLAARWSNGDRIEGLTTRMADLIAPSVMAAMARVSLGVSS